MTTKLRVVAQSNPPPLARAVDDYIQAKRAQGRSAKTIRYAMRFPLVEIFLPWCAANGISKPEQLDTRTLTNYQANLIEHGGKTGTTLKRSSVYSYAKSVKQFVAWLKDEGEAVDGSMKLPSLERRHVVTLTPKEVELMETTANSERDKIIVRLLAETGIRRAECAGLKVRDIDEDRGKFYLLIHGKGARDRKVPVTGSLVRRLRRYINGATKDRAMFVALHREVEGGERLPLTEGGITQMVTGLAETAGIDKKVSPHTLRHTFATHALRRGMDSLLVAQVLGHADTQMLTRTYAHLTPTDAHTALMKVMVAAEDDDE